VFDERIPGDFAEIAVLRSDPRVAVRDLHAAQVAELRSLRGGSDDGTGEDVTGESARWVYYPWRASLVRVLGPRGYRRLRLDRNRHKITAAEQDYYAGLTIGVAGASVGHLVALGLALEGLFGALRIADFDTVEMTNLNRLPGSVLDYGLGKTAVIARRIAELDPYLAVRPFADGVTPAGAAEFVDGLDVLIEVCDSLDVKFALREHAARLGVPVIMVTSDRGTIDVERFDLEPDRAPFHGLVRGLTAATLADLPASAKVPFVLNIIGAEGISARMAASMLEIDRSLTAWPHLAGDAMQAAACAVMAVRRLGQTAGLASGRLHIDIASALDGLADPRPAAEVPPFTVFGDYRNLAEPVSDVEAIVRAAQLAPSGGNAQPWRVTVAERWVDLDVDETRTTTMDVGLRASRVALGAALLNMRIAAAARGMLGPVEFRPGGCARLWLGSGVDEQLVELFKPMLARVTNRHIGQRGHSVPEPDLRALSAAAAAEGGALRLVSGSVGLAEAAQILSDADRVRFLLPRLHREMMAELRDPRTDSLDRGLDIRTLEMGPAAPLLDIAGRPEVVRELAALDGTDGRAEGYGSALSSRVGTLVESSALLAAITVSRAGGVGEPEDYLRGGAAMQRVWIAATAAGLAAQPMVPLFLFARADDDAELSAMAGRYTDRMRAHRQRLRELFALGSEDIFVMVLRLAHAPAPSAISQRSAEVVAHYARDRPKWGKQ
jgi:molybdopterin/thiamine biosynthesis adenylyltransferase